MNSFLFSFCWRFCQNCNLFSWGIFIIQSRTAPILQQNLLPQAIDVKIIHFCKLKHYTLLINLFVKNQHSKWVWNSFQTFLKFDSHFLFMFFFMTYNNFLIFISMILKCTQLIHMHGKSSKTNIASYHYFSCIILHDTIIFIGSRQYNTFILELLMVSSNLWWKKKSLFKFCFILDWVLRFPSVIVKLKSNRLPNNKHIICFIWHNECGCVSMCVYIQWILFIRCQLMELTHLSARNMINTSKNFACCIAQLCCYSLTIFIHEHTFALHSTQSSSISPTKRVFIYCQLHETKTTIWILRITI